MQITQDVWSEDGERQEDYLWGIFELLAAASPPNFPEPSSNESCELE